MAGNQNSKKAASSNKSGKFMKDRKGRITHSKVAGGTPSVAGFFAAQAKGIETSNRFEALEEDMQL